MGGPSNRSHSHAVAGGSHGSSNRGRVAVHHRPSGSGGFFRGSPPSLPPSLPTQPRQSGHDGDSGGGGGALAAGPVAVDDDGPSSDRGEADGSGFDNQGGGGVGVGYELSSGGASAVYGGFGSAGTWGASGDGSSSGLAPPGQVAGPSSASLGAGGLGAEGWLLRFVR